MESTHTAHSAVASGEKAKARDIIAAIRILNQLDAEGRAATPEESTTLARFGGFGPVALTLFPDPVTGRYKDETWRSLGEELKSLLSPDDYESAKRTTFNAFYTSPTVMTAMHRALARLGIPANALVLEPGCGTGNFMVMAPQGMRFIGVELDRTSGRIARALHPNHDIRIEGFQDTQLPEGGIDAVIGNPPFADVKLDYHGQKLSLHDFFIRKSLDALKPGGVLGVVTSHFTLDKQNAAVREAIAETADFVGAIRLPSDAFRREGTSVVTDIVFFRKRAPGEPARHVHPAWLSTVPYEIEHGLHVPINCYMLFHSSMVLGAFSGKNALYGNGYSIVSNGNLEDQLREAIGQLPEFSPMQASPELREPSPRASVGEGGFVPPPLPGHVTEGSFFVGEDRVIRQMIDGEAAPVVYGGKTLRAVGTMTGRRLAALIGLRDDARRVLLSQNNGWPESDRQEARRELNWAYDRFVHTYGPINKTTFSDTRDGGMIRRMPNLVKFREDPDAMLVMSLEEYDETTGKAEKAAIMRKDVVGRHSPVTSVRSAEEGLLVSLDRRGSVDLPYIAKLYGKPEAEIITELGDLIYLDPATNSWETADAYLSGNVRAKLAAAECAGPTFSRNAEALRPVQPEDVLPGDIDAKLGSPWIPESDIQAFAAELFSVPASSISLRQLKKDAVWSVEADHAAERSVAATAEYGTPRISGISLFEQALNMKTPVIYDIVQDGDREVRVVNQEATLAAREKQKGIKERFRSWIFADPERSERLVRLYNDAFNNLRPRAFDGSHLDFPGMNRTIRLRPHQKDAVWRNMSSGNTLLAHCVGAGKTFTMAAAGMKMKQAGLISKPMYVVPNHMLEQFAREFMQLYPNAKLLVAAKEDLTSERRKMLTAKIASGEWDGIIVTHSSFERIGMSRDYRETFLREQIDEYSGLLVDAAASDTTKSGRNLIKTIEKQKAAHEERLKDLLAKEKKDDGLVFDELGVDHLFIDESHFFKNLETPTKMERVAGIQTAGSERAFDLYMKSRYLDQLHPGRGLTFATGTPISNTMVEMYNVQRYLDPRGLSERGIGHFDGWAATFGEVIDTMEISPDGASLKPRSRFARFVNLPELQQMFRAYADVQTAEMLNLPRPTLETGKPIIVACPMSEKQQEMQDSLVARYEAIRCGGIDPRVDNALAITTDGRKLALDARMLTGKAKDHPGSKVNALVENVERIWRTTSASRGTQMIFCDLGVHKTPWGYSVYDEIIGKLVAHGLPRQQIAAIGDADTDAKKQALFERVRNGSVRVLLGSTQKMGTGTNVQKRLVALHHLDAPWKPAEVEQREGRILRQGNENKFVAIYRYVTEKSFDSYMWQALETKAKFIGQVMTGDNAARRADDVASEALSYAEVKAIASGNPAVLTLAEADAELRRLTVLQKNHADEQFLARRHVRDLPPIIERLANRVTALKRDQATVSFHTGAALALDGQEIHRADTLPALNKRLDSLPKWVSSTTRIVLGAYLGLTFGLILRPDFSPEVFLEGATTRHATLSRDHHGPRAVLNALDRLCGSYAEEYEKAERDLTLSQGQLRDYQARLGKPFMHESYLAELAGLRNQLSEALANPMRETAENAGPTTAEISQQIKTLIAGHAVEAAPSRTTSRRVTAAETPVTIRVLRRIEADVPMPTEDGKSTDGTETSRHAAAEAESEQKQAIPAESAVEPTESKGEPPRKQKPDFRERVKRSRRKKDHENQLTLF